MSMVLNLQTTTAEEINRLRNHSDLVISFLENGETDAEEKRIDLDKSWQALHFLFTGTAYDGKPPQAFLLQGGNQIEEIDVGYGPARFQSPIEVDQFSEFLSGLDETNVLERYDTARMSELEIYPGIWEKDEEGENHQEYILENFRRLKVLVTQAKDEGKGIILWFS